jgi:hypothetical protein
MESTPLKAESCSKILGRILAFPALKAFKRWTCVMIMSELPEEFLKEAMPSASSSTIPFTVRVLNENPGC